MDGTNYAAQMTAFGVPNLAPPDQNHPKLSNPHDSTQCAEPEPADLYIAATSTTEV